MGRHEREKVREGIRRRGEMLHGGVQMAWNVGKGREPCMGYETFKFVLVYCPRHDCSIKRTIN